MTSPGAKYFLRKDMQNLLRRRWDPITPEKEHEGTPYCHKPCYATLFGPKACEHSHSPDTGPDRYTKDLKLEVVMRLEATMNQARAKGAPISRGKIGEKVQ
ncbi:hypothetical protein COCON_G00039970 [Conger conger]|uniref:Uncharacterized protein n=1 Tax=Conger conger TaxID=82655 RepID=A0A9Q1I679_CONCO|nr:hypothetical protein COCON_G00039970 [Conger conger]